MATIVTRLDRLQINYESVAKYTYDISFSGIQGSINTAEMKLFMPDFLVYQIEDVREPVKNVFEEVVDGGTLITFDFGALEDLGIAARIAMTVGFNRGTPSGTTYISEPVLWIDGEEVLRSTASTLTLVVITDFRLSMERILPLIEPAAGGSAVIRIELENFGDKGAEISNTLLNCRMPDGITLDTTFDIIGEDKSSNAFKDERVDNLQAEIEGNGFTFEIPAYYGHKYEIMYQVTIDSDLDVGKEIENKAEWTIDGVQQDDGLVLITLAEPNYNGTARKYGPDYTLSNEYISYELYVINDGNQILPQVEVMDEMPPQVKAYEFWTGTFWIGEIKRQLTGSYDVEYTTVKGQTGTLGPFTANVNSQVDLTTIIEEDDKLSKLIWKIDGFGVGVTQRKPPTINGIVDNNTNLGTVVLNHFDFSWDGPLGRDHNLQNQVTVVQDVCIIAPTFKRVDSKNPVKPGDEMTYEMTIDCTRSRLNNPIIATILPETIAYEELVSVTYKEYFPNPEPFPIPPMEVTENYNGLKRTRLIMRFDGDYAFNCRQRSKLKIRFKVRVRVGANGKIAYGMILSNTTNTGVVPSGVEIYRDQYGVIETGQANMLYALTREPGYDIIHFPSIASDKKVKGSLDLEYHEVPVVGETIAGGQVDYKLAVTNIGNVDLRTLEIVDIFPHTNDTGVIQTNQARESKFPVYNVNKVSVTLSPLREGQSEPTIQMMYSKSYNPIRFGPKNNMIGIDNDWQAEMPQLAPELKSFKLTTQNTIIYPEQTLTVHIQGMVPVGVPTDEVAWNSFAAKVSYIDEQGEIQYLLPVEPEKVGIQVKSNPAGKGKIGGIVFRDLDENGMYENTDAGINDALVILYTEDLKPVAATFTVPNMDNVPGFYMFNNLDIGRYYIRVIIDEVEDKFSRQLIDIYNGNKLSSSTGITPLVDLSLAAEQDHIFAGIIKRKPRERVDQVLAINASANKMLRSATYNQLLLGMKLEEVKTLVEEL